jgi:hypothetical protein
VDQWVVFLQPADDHELQLQRFHRQRACYHPACKGLSCSAVDRVSALLLEDLAVG